MRILWLLLALAACGEQRSSDTGPYMGGGTGLNTRVGGSFGAFTGFTR